MLVKPRILHLEDDPDWIRKIKQYLRDEYEVVPASSIADAEDLLDKQNFALALIDVSLVPESGSDEAGFQFVARVRASNLLGDLPIIILTAYDTKDKMKFAFKEFKIFDFVAKGEVNREDFRTLVSRALAQGPQRRDFGEPTKALLVEDDLEWQGRIKHILDEEGCQVDVVNSYREASDKLASQSYHLATVDIRLNDLDSTDFRGSELVGIIRQLQGQSVNIIFISGYGTPEQMQRAAFDLNAKDFIDKGDFQAQRLRNRIRKILQDLLYVTVSVGDGEDSPTLKLGEAQRLTVSVSRSKPYKGISRLIESPVTSGRFDLLVVVQPFAIKVLGDGAEFISVLPGAVPEPISFQIIPTVAGTTEIMIDFFFGSVQLRRMNIVANVIE